MKSRKEYTDQIIINTGLYSAKAYNALWLVKMMGDEVEFPFDDLKEHEHLHFLQHEDSMDHPWIAVHDIFRRSSDGEICFLLAPAKCFHKSQENICKSIKANFKKALPYIAQGIRSAYILLNRKVWHKFSYSEEKTMHLHVGFNNEVECSFNECHYVRYFPSGDINIVKQFAAPLNIYQSFIDISFDTLKTLTAIYHLFTDDQNDNTKFATYADWAIENKCIDIDEVIGAPRDPFAANAQAAMKKWQCDLYDEYDSKVTDVYFDSLNSTIEKKANQWEDAYVNGRNALALEYLTKIEEADYSNC